MTNTLIFVDLPTPDVEASTEFYRELFGWTINPRPQGVFHQVVPGEGLHLGIFSETEQYPDPAPLPTQPRSGLHTRVYILVDAPPGDYLNKAVLLGATALWEQSFWKEFNGHHASFLDPWGNQIVMWRAPDADEAAAAESDS
ncbi:VOC family protein [Streptomyces sp. NPDC056500]|uniref:VOC family protein n=1 Tax=Streptomyces sp. NPDC056500 TaxID=3345840 RepID=UPI003674D585